MAQRFYIYNEINLFNNERIAKKSRKIFRLSVLIDTIYFFLYLPFFLNKKYVLFVEHINRGHYENDSFKDIYFENYKKYFEDADYKILNITSFSQRNSAKILHIPCFIYDIIIYTSSLFPFPPKYKGYISLLMDHHSFLKIKKLKRRVCMNHFAPFILKKLFCNFKPSFVFFIEYYNSVNSLVSCLNLLSVKTYEFQHGIINNYHYGYNFPYKCNSKSLLKNLIFWGEFWLENYKYNQNFHCHIGKYFHFFDKKLSLKTKEIKNSILIISQPFYFTLFK